MVMHECVYPKQVERMLNVMTLVPPYGWGMLLAEVEKRIGTDDLERIIERVYHETEYRKIEDLKRALAVLSERKTTGKSTSERRRKPPPRNKSA
jgi:hypothetical protein